MTRVAMIVGEGFEDSEFQVPYERLKNAGHEVEVMGTEAGSEVQGKRGEVRAHVDVSAEDASPDRYDALVIPGGHGPDRLRTNAAVVSFVRSFMSLGKPVAAICHGPQLLIEAGVVRGRTLTSWPSVKTDLINAGASWIDQAVVIDGNLITSRKPGDLDVFCGRIEQALEHPPGHRSGPERAGSTDPAGVPDVKLDEEGFLVDPADWDERLASWLAREEGLGALSDARWRVIRALREWYLEHHTVPDFRRVCEAAQQDDPFCMEKLFDNDGSKAWRIAGLPNPGEELKAYL